MSRRVYEVARELGLSPEEVMGRLNDAGVQTESNFSVVEDSAYERVFGDGPRSNGSGGATPKGRPEAREAKASPRRTRPPRTRSRALRRAVVYVLVAALAFALSAGVGAVVALVLREDTAPTPVQEGPRPPEQQGDAQQARELDVAPEGGGGADRAHQEEADAAQVEDAPQREGGVSRLGEAEYLSRVGDIQSETVETFMDSHNKLLRYDALTARDIDEMRANEAAVEKMAREANDLAPPRNYEEQHEVFGSAVTGLHEAARMAYETSKRSGRGGRDRIRRVRRPRQPGRGPPGAIQRDAGSGLRDHRRPAGDQPAAKRKGTRAWFGRSSADLAGGDHESGKETNRRCPGHRVFGVTDHGG